MTVRIWMAVSADDYELPLAIGDTAEELGLYLNVSANRVQKAKCYNEKVRFGKERAYIRLVEKKIKTKKYNKSYSERMEYYRERYARKKLSAGLTQKE